MCELASEEELAVFDRIGALQASKTTPEDKQRQMDQIRAEYIAVLEAEANPQQRRRYRMMRAEGVPDEQCDKVLIEAAMLRRKKRLEKKKDDESSWVKGMFNK